MAKSHEDITEELDQTPEETPESDEGQEQEDQPSLREKLEADLSEEDVAEGEQEAEQPAQQAEQPQEEAPADDTPFSTRNYLINELGWNPEQIPDEQAAFNAALQAAVQQERYQWQQQHSTVQSEMEQLREQLQSFQQPQETADPEKPLYEPLPEYNPEWRYMLDENGNPVSGADPTLPQKISAYDDALKGRITDFARDPASFLQPFAEQLKQSVLEDAKNEIQQSFQTHQREQNADGWISQNVGRFFQTDANGQPLRDHSGREVYSQEGARAMHFLEEAKQMGINDQQALVAYTERMLAFENLLSQQQPNQEASPAEQQKAEKERVRALNKPGRGAGRAAAKPQPGNGDTYQRGLSTALAEALADVPEEEFETV